MNLKDPASLRLIISVGFGISILYSLWIVSLFRRRKDGKPRRRRGKDWMWIPLAVVTVVMLVALWWHMRQVP